MALQATHYRIARDVLPHLSITDTAEYYAGTLYPDSRYMSGLRRRLTHGDGCPKNPFAPGLSDFERGWAVHLQYDEVAGEAQKTLIPAGILLDDGMGEGWRHFTVAKLVEDEASCVTLGSELAQIQLVHPTKVPNGENVEKVDAYYRLVRALYENGPPTFEDHQRHYRGMIAEDIVQDLLALYRAVREDPAYVAKAQAIYAQAYEVIRALRP